MRNLLAGTIADREREAILAMRARTHGAKIMMRAHTHDGDVRTHTHSRNAQAAALMPMNTPLFGHAHLTHEPYSRSDKEEHRQTFARFDHVWVLRAERVEELQQQFSAAVVVPFAITPHDLQCLVHRSLGVALREQQNS